MLKSAEERPTADGRGDEADDDHVAALDDHPQMRCILCLFEGGTSGAADGYFRMSRNVAATLLHLAPGFGNAFANLHNARKAQSGVLNVMGEHATYHLRHESPLKGDTAGISHSISHWTRTSADAAQGAELLLLHPGPLDWLKVAA
mgnify:CR=1 FL=1